MLKISWDRCWSSLLGKDNGINLMRLLISCYEESHRKYHTTQHLYECIEIFQDNIQQASEPAEIEMALWFHDAIYDVHKNDNEEKSANLAEEYLIKAGLSNNRIERIKQLILATCHSTLPNNNDHKLIVDIDLSILGSQPKRFDEYENQIREEYSWVSDFAFREKRALVLNEFLSRDPLYQTKKIQQIFEQQAKENLTKSIKKLITP